MWLSLGVAISFREIKFCFIIKIYLTVIQKQGTIMYNVYILEKSQIIKEVSNRSKCTDICQSIVFCMLYIVYTSKRVE